MIKNPTFTNFMSDIEIYVDNLAAMQIHNMNKYIEYTRAKLQEKGTSTTEVDEIEEAFEQVQKADNAIQAQMIMYSKMFKINFSKMDPYEFKTFTDILQRYSDAFKPPKGCGHGNKNR